MMNIKKTTKLNGKKGQDSTHVSKTYPVLTTTYVCVSDEMCAV